jgi:enamine deaminase RidA (YjgF/YER057c/UK114 family)
MARLHDPSPLEPINPPELGVPQGYSNGLLAPAGGRLLFIAGQIAWDQQQKLVGEDFPTQFGQALSNVVTVVTAAGGRPTDLAQLTIYVTDRQEYLGNLKAVGAAYRQIMGRHYPTMALVEIRALLEPGARVEIQGMAVLQESAPAGDSDGP